MSLPHRHTTHGVEFESMDAKTNLEDHVSVGSGGTTARPPPSVDHDGKIFHIENYFGGQRGGQRELLTYVIDNTGEGKLVDTSLRDLMNEINAATMAFDGDIARADGAEGPTGHHPATFAKEKGGSEHRHPSRKGSLMMKTHDLSHFPHVPSSSNLAAAGSSTLDSYVSRLKLRDLRRLDFHFNPNDEKSFLVRRHVILFAMDPLRAVIMCNKVVLFVPAGADTILARLTHHLRVDKADKYSAFELHALDALLKTVIDAEREAFVSIEDQIKRTLQYFKMGSLLSIEIQEEMRMLKNQLSQLMNRLGLSQSVLEQLTEDDEEMALMNLSVLRQKPSLYKLPLSPEIMATHDRSEELLETHLIDVNAVCSKIALLRTNIQNGEDMVSLRLDTSRNELLITNTALTMLSCGIGFGAYVTGVFGMNLDQTEYLEPRRNSFVIVTMLSFLGVILVFGLGYGYLKMAGILPERVKIPTHKGLLADQLTTSRLST